MPNWVQNNITFSGDAAEIKKMLEAIKAVLIRVNTLRKFEGVELSVADIEINDDSTGVSSYIETYLDVDKKFGTNINDDCDSWLNFYAEYFPESKELKCEYYVHTPNKEPDYIQSSFSNADNLHICNHPWCNCMSYDKFLRLCEQDIAAGS